MREKLYCMCRLWDAFTQVYKNSFKSMTSQVRKSWWQCSVRQRLKTLYYTNHNWINPKYLFCTVQKRVSLIKITHWSMNDLRMTFVKSNPWNSTVHFSMFFSAMLHWEAPLKIVSHGKSEKYFTHWLTYFIHWVIFQNHLDY